MLRESQEIVGRTQNIGAVGVHQHVETDATYSLSTRDKRFSGFDSQRRLPPSNTLLYRSESLRIALDPSTATTCERP
jgi:hypothetical protein